ncbi:uncharacterized protein LOC120340917 [Styela clava]
MKGLLFFAITCVLADVSVSLTPFQLRYKISKTQCAPVSGYEDKVIPCYDFRRMKIVDPTKCGHKAYSHCCVYNCTCIMKGAGTSAGIIPENFKLKIASPIKKKHIPPRLLEGCVPDPPVDDSTTVKPPVKPSERPVIVKPKPSVRRPIVPTKKPIPRKPVPKPKKPVSKKPARKPTIKKPVSRRPAIRKPTIKKPTAKRPATKKPWTKKPTSRKPVVKKPMAIRPTPKKTVKKPVRRKPLNTKKPIARKPTQRKPLKRKPPVKKPTPSPKTTKKPCAKSTKATKKPAFSLDFFSRLSFMMRGFGFNSEVVENDDC